MVSYPPIPARPGTGGPRSVDGGGGAGRGRGAGGGAAWAGGAWRGECRRRWRELPAGPPEVETYRHAPVPWRWSADAVAAGQAAAGFEQYGGFVEAADHFVECGHSAGGVECGAHGDRG